MSYSQLLSQICDQTYKMLEFAQSRQWEELIETEGLRSQSLDKLTALQPEPTQESAIQEKLKEILEINGLIASLSVQEKNSTVAEFLKVKNNKKAASEYSRY